MILLSVTIIAKDEEDNIAGAIQSVPFADEWIVIVDPSTRDRTAEIARSLGAKVVIEPWRGYGQQKNFAASIAAGKWILNLDADERLSESLQREIREVIQSDRFQGYEMPRATRYLGRFIRHGGWYPNYLVRLARKDSSRWSEPTLHEALQVNGSVGRLKYPLSHEPFSEGIEDQVLTNLRYTQLQALPLVERRRIPSTFEVLGRVIWKFMSIYYLKRGFLDGWPGLVVAINSAHATFLKYAFAWEKQTLHPLKTLDEGKLSDAQTPHH